MISLLNRASPAEKPVGWFVNLLSFFLFVVASCCQNLIMLFAGSTLHHVFLQIV